MTDVLLWVALPYLVIAVFVLGHIWRYRYDKFGWTTRSSQLYESRLLRVGSPLFHFGILLVLLGHVGGLVGVFEPEQRHAAFAGVAVGVVGQVQAAAFAVVERRDVVGGELW